MAQGTSALEGSLPRSAHEALGLHLMGEAVGQGWTDDEAKSFEDGFREFRQDFDAISKQYLPHRKPENLSLFFYNMWKTRIHPQAQAWYERKEVIADCASYPSSVSSTQEMYLIEFIVAACMLLLSVWSTSCTVANTGSIMSAVCLQVLALALSCSGAFKCSVVPRSAALLIHWVATLFWC